MNKKELNWLLQDQGHENRKAIGPGAVRARQNFVSADGPYSPETRLDQPHANQFAITTTGYLVGFTMTEFRIFVA
jgi:hypothetical protein